MIPLFVSEHGTLKQRVGGQAIFRLYVIGYSRVLFHFRDVTGCTPTAGVSDCTYRHLMFECRCNNSAAFFCPCGTCYVPRRWGPGAAVLTFFVDGERICFTDLSKHQLSRDQMGCCFSARHPRVSCKLTKARLLVYKSQSLVRASSVASILT